MYLTVELVKSSSLFSQMQKIYSSILLGFDFLEVSNFDQFFNDCRDRRRCDFQFFCQVSKRRKKLRVGRSALHRVPRGFWVQKESEG